MSKNRQADDGADPMAAEGRAVVIESGVELVDTEALDQVFGPLAHTEAFLVPKEPIQRRFYDPLTAPGLFQRFAETRLEPDSIRTFAEEHGMLGRAVTTILPSTYSPTGTRGGERVAEWRYEIMSLRTMARLWEAVRTRNQLQLARHLVRSDKWNEHPFAAAYMRAIAGDSPAWVLLRRDDADCVDTAYKVAAASAEGIPNEWEAAEAALLQSVNEHLEEYCRPYLDRRSQRAEGHIIRVAPRTLLGAMWWQFARTVMGETAYRKCRVCSRLIELSKGDQGFRADREFCSNACKLKDHRTKVKRAKQLRQSGRTVKQIAIELKTTTHSIKKWLTKSK